MISNNTFKIPQKLSYLDLPNYFLKIYLKPIYLKNKDDEESEQMIFNDEANQQPAPTNIYVVSTEFQYSKSKCLSVQIIKRVDIVESDKNFHTQLRIISLADSSPN